MVQGLAAPAALPRASAVLILAPTRWLTTTCHSTSRDLMPSWALQTQSAQTHMKARHSYTLKRVFKQVKYTYKLCVMVTVIWRGENADSTVQC